jgi:prevent-host-death family protein
MTRVNIHAATARLPELLDRVESGEQVAITRNGRTVAKLVAHSRKRNYRSIVGVWHGKVDMSHFHEGDEQIARDFGTIE